MVYIKSFYEEEIAKLEHDFIKGIEILDGGEQLVWYLGGVRDFADRIMAEIRAHCEKESGVV